MMAAILCAPTGWLRVGGRDSAWKQEKLEATLREMLENAALGERASNEHRPVKAHWRLTSHTSARMQG